MEFPTALKLSQEYLINSKGNMEEMCTVGKLILKKKAENIYIYTYTHTYTHTHQKWSIMLKNNEKAPASQAGLCCHFLATIAFTYFCFYLEKKQ